MNASVAPDQSPAAGPGFGAIITLVVAVPMIGLLAAAALPAYRDSLIRQGLAEVVSVGWRAAHAVDGFMAREGTLPENLEEAEFSLESPRVRDIQLAHDGVIRLAVNIPELDAGLVVFTPFAPDINGGLLWKCGAKDIPRIYLPPDCL